MLDFLFEFVFGIYFELLSEIIPGINMSKKLEILVHIIACVLTIGLIVVFICGYGFIKTNRIALGVTLIAIVIAVLLAQIIAGLILHKRR